MKIEILNIKKSTISIDGSIDAVVKLGDSVGEMTLCPRQDGYPLHAFGSTDYAQWVCHNLYKLPKEALESLEKAVAKVAKEKGNWHYFDSFWAYDAPIH